MMGWLFGDKTSGTHRDEADRIWISEADKLHGLTTLASRLSADLVLLVAHFPSTLKALEERFTQPSRRVALLLAEQLDRYGGSSHFTSAAKIGGDFDSRSTIQASILVAERHFLRDRDDAIVAAVRRFPFSTSMGFHLSLEDPLLKELLDDWSQQLISRLLTADTQPLSSPVLTSAIERAQRHAADRYPSDHPSDSPHEWLTRNAASQGR